MTAYLVKGIATYAKTPSDLKGVSEWLATSKLLYGTLQNSDFLIWSKDKQRNVKSRCEFPCQLRSSGHVACAQVHSYIHFSDELVAQRCVFPA